MKNPFTNFLEKENFDDIMNSIKDFCEECPFEKTSSECINCYLRGWLDKIR